MKKLFTVLILITTFSCGKGELESPREDKWMNPDLTVTIAENETPIQQYPYHPDLEDHERNDPDGFIDFIQRMNINFEESGYSKTEAEIIYQMIFDHHLVVDESYGMPSPEEVIEQPELSEIKQRVMIKKKSINELEVFYWNIGCGRNFHHQKVRFNEETMQLIESDENQELERWSLLYPC